MSHPRAPSLALLVACALCVCACGEHSLAPSTDGGSVAFDGSLPITTDAAASACTLEADTRATVTVSASGCALLDRDTGACEAARKAQGLSGYWLRFSCRVTLERVSTGGATTVHATTDAQPDYPS